MDTLGGLQVIDLSYGIAGPIVGAFSADFGAEVIKVEPPEGDPARAEPGFTAWNRGKKSVTVDPADPARQRSLVRRQGVARPAGRRPRRRLAAVLVRRRPGGVRGALPLAGQRPVG